MQNELVTITPAMQPNEERSVELWTYLMQGDCLEKMKEIPDNYVDMIMCDLPYGTTACAWDVVIPLPELWAAYNRIGRDNTPFVLTASQPFTSALVSSNFRAFKYGWVWEKEQGTGFANAKKMPLKSHEDVCVFYRRPPQYVPQGLVPCVRHRHHGTEDVGRALGKNGLHGKDFTQEWGNYPKSVIRFPRDQNKMHPTQKPVALMEYLIKTYTNPGDIVLDNCMGSGTTGVACVNTGRNFIGIEKDEKYFAIAKERIENAKLQLVTRCDGSRGTD